MTGDEELRAWAKDARRRHDDRKKEEAARNEDYAKRTWSQSDQLHGDLLRASLESASRALQALVLVNGGAAVALVAFLGSLAAANIPANSPRAAYIGYAAEALVWSGKGLMIALVTLAIAYMVNMMAAEAHRSRRRTIEYPYVIDTPASSRWTIWSLSLNIVGVIYFFGSLWCTAAGMLVMVRFL